MKCYNCKADVTAEMLFCYVCGSPQKFMEFVQRAMRNEQDATAQLYKMTYNNVYQTICMTASLDDDTVFDLVQDTYIKAFRNLAQLNEAEAFRGWIKVIARNLTIDFLRKKKMVTFSKTISVDSEEMVELVDERQENLPEAVTDQKETARLLQEILGQLSEEQRVVVSMYYFEELSVKEIADILQVSDGTVKSRLNYGRKKIETGVLELEKKGTKLYGLAPIPFLLLLLRSQEVHAAYMPNAAVLQTVQKVLLSESSSAPGTGAAQTAGQGTAETVGANAAKAAGAAGKAAGVAGKGAFVKVIAGVVAAAVVGGGAIGISLKNRDEAQVPNEDVLVTEEAEAPEEEVLAREEAEVPEEEVLATEEAEMPQDMQLEDFLGGYTNEYYMLDLVYADNVLTLASGILPGREMVVYTYEDVQIEGNVLRAKHTDFSESGIVNEDGSLTSVATDGIDTFVINEDGTLTVTFAGINEIRSGIY